MNFKIYIQLLNILSTFCFKQPIPFADSSLSKQGIHKIAIPDNEDVAVWWNMKDQKWNAVHDMCPHRQASLSSGVVNPITNDIKCRYHGMEFNGCGKCTLIPSSAFSPSTFSVKKYYIKEKYDLLWIDDEKDNDLVIDVMERPHSKLPWFISSAEGDYKSLIENSMDGAHFNQVHHGMMGLNRYKSMGEYNKAETNWFNSSGFSCTIGTTSTTNTLLPIAECIFMAPYNTQVKLSNTYIFAITYPVDKKKLKLVSNLIVHDKKTYLDLFFEIFKPLIRISGKEVFRQDIEIINSQKQNVYNHGINYTTISQSDLPITLYNKWLKKYGDEEES